MSSDRYVVLSFRRQPAPVYSFVYLTRYFGFGAKIDEVSVLQVGGKVKIFQLFLKFFWAQKKR